MYMYLLVLNIFIEVLVAFVATRKVGVLLQLHGRIERDRVELEARGDSEFGIGVIFVRSGHEA